MNTEPRDTHEDGPYATAGREIGLLVEKKNAAYGSAFDKCGAYWRILYPDGIRPDQYEDALGLARDFDKSMRIATDRDALGESPWRDKAGYGILGAVRVEREKGAGGGK